MYCRRNVAPATIATPFAVDFDCGRTRMLPRRAGTVRDERAEESERMPQMAAPAETSGVYLDYSKNRVNEETLKLLIELAQQAGLRARIDAMFRGEKINVTENRAVLHV